MAKTVNEVRLAGNAGKDAARFGNGPFKFSLATGGGKKKDGSGDWPTHWHSIVCWPNRVEGADFVRKGCHVEVEGRLEYEKWTDKKTGQERTQAVVVATSISVGDSGSSFEREIESAVVPQSTRIASPSVTGQITDEDIPF